MSSSTPFAKTPSVRRPQDEIEAEFEERSSSSPVLPTRLRFPSSLSRHGDAIDDASDDEEGEAARRPQSLVHDDEDDLSDLLYLEKLRDTKALRHPDHEYGVYQFSSLPRKRQRISETDTAMDDVIALSSSPSPAPPHSVQVSDGEDYQVGFSHLDPVEAAEASESHADEDFTSSPTGLTSTSASSKFRRPMSPAFPTSTPFTRPAFKTPQVQSAAAMDQSTFSSLPDAFSPSRRRGKKDYIPGGAADTVRSWILALAADESKANQTYTKTFKVLETTNGYRGDRCELVKDEDDRRWLLINEGAKAGGRESDSAPKKPTVGCTIGIRASSTAMNLQPERPKPKPLDKGSENEVEMIAEEWSVGILWDVLG